MRDRVQASERHEVTSHLWQHQVFPVGEVELGAPRGVCVCDRLVQGLKLGNQAHDPPLNLTVASLCGTTGIV
jgi:hypothetical protein